MKIYNLILLTLSVLQFGGPFVSALLAHDQERYIAQIYNDTGNPATQTVGLVPVRRHGENTLTFPESRNMICEDDILTRVTPHNGWVILGLTNNQGTDVHGKAAAAIVQMKDIRGAQKYEWIRLHFADGDMLPYNELCTKLHSELQARGADYQFEPVVQFNNDSHTDRRVFAIGYEALSRAEQTHHKPLAFKKELGGLAAREDGTIYAEDLKEFGDQVTLRTLYGKGDGDGGSSYILRRNKNGNWETFQKAVTLTDAESNWDAILPFSDAGFQLVVEDASKDPRTVVVLDKQPLGTIPSSGRLLVSIPDLRGRDSRITVNVVYRPKGGIEQSEFRVYRKQREAYVEIGQAKILRSDGSSEAVSAPAAEAAATLEPLAVWSVNPD